MKFELLPSEEGFMRLPAEDAADPQKARAAIIPFGLEHTVSYKGGTSRGPAAILDASPELEWYDEAFAKEAFRDYGFVTLREPQIPSGQEEALELLEAMVEDALMAGKFPLTLGGEHALTPGAIRPFARRYPDLVILHFDAHADLRDGYMGEKYSHAAALRRCLDYRDIQLVSFGIRNISAEEVPFLEANKHRITIFWGKDKENWNPKNITRLFKDRPVYLTFDLDGFDSSLMPATGTPEPGGLFWDEAIDIIRIAAEAGTIVGADINELAPIPYFHSCDFLAAKLAYKIMSYALTRPAENALFASP